MKVLYVILVIILILIIYKNQNRKQINKFENSTNAKTKDTLVLYTFHEINNNVKYFINQGIFKDDSIDFIMICNNETLKIDVPDYVKFINRKNIGYDFGGWSEGLLTNNLYMNYKHFIFVNSSVIGPTVPKYYKNKWTDIFLDGLKDNVKLYGSTINTSGLYGNDPINSSHVQSYAFCVDIDTLKFLINKEIFSMTNMISKYEDVVINKEIKMSRDIISNNWNIGCIFHHYNGIDFTKLSKYTDFQFLNNLTVLGYYTQLISPYDVIFVKEKYVSNKYWLNSHLNDAKLEDKI
jgi:hypothetical protein